MIDAVVVAMLLSPMAPGEKAFWAFWGLVVPFGVALAARHRYASVAAWARELVSTEGNEAVGVAFSRGASYVDGSSAPATPSIEMYSRGVLLATETELQLWAGPEARKPLVVGPLTDIVTVGCERKLPGLGFAPLLTLTFTDGLVIELVVVRGVWTDMFGPSTTHLGRVVEALRAKISPAAPVP
ncbi:hypothetical protein [Mycetocola zhujimingii]|uniref:hypothetical protein n=1 Tax=Mycetocola zhujimingii TaxID=2079792 RepID=UPI0013C42548|nr:hypothetical protein [Mycetocola zhujimingii]